VTLPATTTTTTTSLSQSLITLIMSQSSIMSQNPKAYFVFVHIIIANA
jgi:hypothetical protein